MTITKKINQVDSKKVYIAGGLLSGCGALILNIMPIFVGALKNAFGFSESQLGDVIGGYYLAFTIVAVTALVWVRKVNWRRSAGISIGIACLSLLSLQIAQGFGLVMISMIVIGLAFGGLYAMIMAVFSDSDDPDRAYGVKLGLETMPSVVLLFILPALVIPAFGFQGMLYTIVATLVILTLPYRWLPEKNARVFQPVSLSSLRSSPSLLLSFISLISSLTYSAGLVAAWAFLELLADNQQVSSEDVGTILAGGFIVCGIGGFAAAIISDRWGRFVPFIFIVITNIASLGLLSVFTTTAEFAVGVCTFLFTVNFGLAYTFGLTAEVDNTGRIAVLSAAMLSVGAAIGPIVGGRLLESLGVDAMLAFSAACMLVSVVCYVSVVVRHNALA